MQFHNFKTHSNNLIYASQLDSVTLVTSLNEQNSQQCSTQNIQPANQMFARKNRIESQYIHS